VEELNSNLFDPLFKFNKSILFLQILSFINILLNIIIINLIRIIIYFRIQTWISHDIFQ